MPTRSPHEEPKKTRKKKPHQPRLQLPADNLVVLRFHDLVDRGIVNSRPTVRRWIAAGTFPKPIHLGKNSVAWRAADIEAWLNKQMLGGAA